MNLNLSTIQSSLLGLIVILLAACGQEKVAQKPTFIQEGEVSYYHKSLEGGRTASGIPFRNDSPYAAHRHLPLGTEIEVINLKNDSTMMLKVVDRGPYAKDRILDVSGMAADKLNFREQGHTQIRLHAFVADSIADSIRNKVPPSSLPKGEYTP